MAANCKNTASLPVLYWQDNWTPDIDQKKAPPFARRGEFPQVKEKAAACACARFSAWSRGSKKSHCGLAYPDSIAAAR